MKIKPLSILAILAISVSANADYTVYGGSSSGDYYGMAEKTAKQLKPALEKQWVTEDVKAGTSEGTPEIIKNVCADVNASGFIQGNVEAPDCAKVAKSKVASEIVFAVVNPWVAAKIDDYKNNRLAVWQAIVDNKDKVNFYVRPGSGHEATHSQLKEVSGLPEGVDGGSSNEAILKSISANKVGVSLFTQFARADSGLFKQIDQLKLVVIPVMTSEMKDFELNGEKVYSVCSDAKVSSPLIGKAVKITTACVGANYIINASASNEEIAAIESVDFEAVVPKEGLFSILKSKIGSNVGGASSAFSDLMEVAKDKAKGFELNLI